MEKNELQKLLDARFAEMAQAFVDYIKDADDNDLEFDEITSGHFSMHFNHAKVSVAASNPYCFMQIYAFPDVKDKDFIKRATELLNSPALKAKRMDDLKNLIDSYQKELDALKGQK